VGTVGNDNWMFFFAARVHLHFDLAQGFGYIGFVGEWVLWSESWG